MSEKLQLLRREVIAAAEGVCALATVDCGVKETLLDMQRYNFPNNDLIVGFGNRVVQALCLNVEAVAE